MNWFKITNWLQKGDKNSFDIPVKIQKLFLQSQGEAKDIIDRSYKQYLCQNVFIPRVKIILFNIIFGIALPIILLYFVTKGCFLKRGIHIAAIIEDKKMEEVVPDQLLQQYNPVSSPWNTKPSLKLKDISFILKLIAKAPFSPYYTFKIMMNLTRYSSIVHIHQPETIIQFGEFSFSRTALTEYCHIYGIKHINVMHGEKLFFIRDAYFAFDECYVWNEHYVELMKSLYAEPTQFKICLPHSMKVDINHYKNENYYADYKYYLALTSEEELKRLVAAMAFLKHLGKSIKYRPHPRYTDMNLLKKYVSDYEIENWREVSILESLSNVSTVVGVYTTVLVQAYFSGINVMLDDVSNPDQYKKLKEMKYILADKVDNKLSFYQSK